MLLAIDDLLAAAASPQAPAPPSQNYRFREVAELAAEYANQQGNDISILARAVLSLLPAPGASPGLEGLERIAQEIWSAFAESDMLPKDHNALMHMVWIQKIVAILSRSLEGRGGGQHRSLDISRDTMSKLIVGYMESHCTEDIPPKLLSVLLKVVEEGNRKFPWSPQSDDVVKPHDYWPEYNKAVGELDALRRERDDEFLKRAAWHKRAETAEAKLFESDAFRGELRRELDLSTTRATQLEAALREIRKQICSIPLSQITAMEEHVRSLAEAALGPVAQESTE